MEMLDRIPDFANVRGMLDHIQDSTNVREIVFYTPLMWESYAG
jgi:hypothetical protein